MFTRFRISVGLAMLAVLTVVTAVSAKGGFSYVTIAGPGIKESIQTSDLSFTQSFFAFADFYRDRTEAPADPGEGYLVTRFYLEGSRGVAFDRLHYYPASGYVYYDGIANGSSEYDRKWYTAQPGIQAQFEELLSGALAVKPEPVVARPQPVAPTEDETPAPLGLSPLAASSVLTAGLALLLVFVLSRRKVSAQ